jgi:hypothetical protein
VGDSYEEVDEAVTKSGIQDHVILTNVPTTVNFVYVRGPGVRPPSGRSFGPSWTPHFGPRADVRAHRSHSAFISSEGGHGSRRE